MFHVGSRFHFVFHARLQTFFNASQNCSFALNPKQKVMKKKKKGMLLLLTQNHRFFYLTSPEVSVWQNSGRKVDIRVRSNPVPSASLLPLPSPSLISRLLPLLLFKIKPHTGDFGNELPHWGHCYLHLRAASTFLCWSTQENG